MRTPNTIARSRPLRGEEAFVYGLKNRAKKQHCLGYGTFSVEMDRLEQLRKAYCRAVAPVTKVTLLVKALALAVAQNPKVNAILFRRLLGPRIVQFERVDVNLPIMRRIGQRTITFIGVIRNAPEKSLAEIQQELTNYQRCDPAQSPAIRRVMWFDGKPLWLARLVHWRMGSDPEFYIRNVGTCGLTLGHGNHEHAFPIAPTSAVFALGGVARRPVVRGEEVAVARVMKCTLMIDNFVVPGLVGERLIYDFQRLLESGSFVQDELDAVESPHEASTVRDQQRV
jgi:pyruvate/2-oxoglutarate dehydrogenase complex dihydrolipoamide acyltransferase (E2) component